MQSKLRYMFLILSTPHIHPEICLNAQGNGVEVHPQKSPMVWGLLGETDWGGEGILEEDFRPSLCYSTCLTDHYC